MSDELSQKMSEAINDEQDRREAEARGDIVMLSYNREASIWELKFHGERSWANQLPGFRSMNDPDDFERVNGIVASRGLRSVGPGTWVSEDGGWHTLVTRLES